METETAAFVPKVIQIQGGEYIEVAERVRWFRHAHPDGVIQVEIAHLDGQTGYAVVKATISAPGLGLAENYGSAWRDVLKAKHKNNDAIAGDFVEFATTSAIGRALAALGFGTLNALDVKHDKPVDSPRGNGHTATAPAQEGPVERTPGGATVKQVRAVYAIAKSKWGWTEQQTAGKVEEQFGHVPENLNGKQASEVIQWLQDPQ